MEDLMQAWEELDQIDAVVRDYEKHHYDLSKARKHIQAAMMIIRRSAEDLGRPDESLDLKDLMIVENKGSTLESMDEDCEILGVPLKLDEACALDFDKHIDAIILDEEARLEDSQKHRSLNIAQLNKQEYDRRYKEMPRDRIRFKR